MNISDALDALIVVQAGLSITEPVEMDVKHAWKWVPEQKAALRLPDWVNSAQLNTVTRQMGNHSLFWTVHMQLFAVPSNVQDDLAQDICAHFLTAVIAAFDLAANRTLGGTVSRHALRGNDPTVGRLEHNGQSYMGLDLFLDLEMEEARA